MKFETHNPHLGEGRVHTQVFLSLLKNIKRQYGLYPPGVQTKILDPEKLKSEGGGQTILSGPEKLKSVVGGNQTRIPNPRMFKFLLHTKKMPWMYQSQNKHRNSQAFTKGHNNITIHFVNS